MTTGLIVLIGAVGVFLVSLLLDFVKGEVRGRVEALPYVLLRIARWRLPAELRVDRHEEEWRPELANILARADKLPITRLIQGSWFAVGQIRSAKAVGDELGGLPPVAEADWLAVMRRAACDEDRYRILNA